MELTNEQIERQDEIYNGVFELCKIMSENQELEWNMSFIGEITDCAESILMRHGIRVRFPAIVTDPDGSEHVEEYCDYDRA